MSVMVLHALADRRSDGDTKFPAALFMITWKHTQEPEVNLRSTLDKTMMSLDQTLMLLNQTDLITLLLDYEKLKL